MTVTGPPDASDPAHPPGDAQAETDWSWTAADPHWIPPHIDTSRPSPARMCNAALGGKDNFAIDREAVAEISAVVPDFGRLTLANRSFLVRAVDAMARDGIDQFLDLGTGIPASPSVHEVAQQVHPGAHVAYVDNDPAVMVQNRALQGTYDGVITAGLDLRQPDVLLADPAIQKELDFSRPIGLVLTSVLHFVRGDLAPRMIARYREALAPGSQLAISVACRDGTPPEVLRTMEAVYGRSLTPITFRSHCQIEQLFEGWDLAEPGITDVTEWRTDGEPCTLSMLAGLGRRV